MPSQEKYNLLVFDSTHHALTAEDQLKDNGYQIMVVPVPPEISAGCGLAVKFKGNPQEILAIIEEGDIQTAGCYRVVKEGLEKRISPL